MQRLVSEQFPFLPVRLILKYPLNSAENIQSVDCPTLILHGDLDIVIPINHAKDLSEIKGELVIIKGEDHVNLYSFTEFWNSIDDFLDTK